VGVVNFNNMKFNKGNKECINIRGRTFILLSVFIIWYERGEVAPAFCLGFDTGRVIRGLLQMFPRSVGSAGLALKQ
jgi:hypothetical protein